MIIFRNAASTSTALPDPFRRASRFQRHLVSSDAKEQRMQVREAAVMVRPVVLRRVVGDRISAHERLLQIGCRHPVTAATRS